MYTKQYFYDFQQGLKGPVAFSYNSALWGFAVFVSTHFNVKKFSLVRTIGTIGKIAILLCRLDFSSHLTLYNEKTTC